MVYAALSLRTAVPNGGNDQKGLAMPWQCLVQAIRYRSGRISQQPPACHSHCSRGVLLSTDTPATRGVLDEATQSSRVPTLHGGDVCRLLTAEFPQQLQWDESAE